MVTYLFYTIGDLTYQSPLVYISIRKGRQKKGMEQREKETERLLLAIDVVEN